MTPEEATKKLFLAIHAAEAAPAQRIGDLKAALDAGADVNARDDFKRTPLHWADSVEIAQMLLDRGADPTAKDKFRNKPVSYARQEGNHELAVLLRDAKKKQGVVDHVREPKTTHAEDVADRKSERGTRRPGD